MQSTFLDVWVSAAKQHRKWKRKRLEQCLKEVDSQESVRYVANCLYNPLLMEIPNLLVLFIFFIFITQLGCPKITCCIMFVQVDIVSIKYQMLPSKKDLKIL